MHNQDSSRDLVGKARAVVAMHPDEDSLSDEFHGLVIFRRGHGCSGGVGPPGRLPFRRDLEAVTRRFFLWAFIQAARWCPAAFSQLSSATDVSSMAVELRAPRLDVLREK